MEVRCTGCNKLFRVSDDKITGSGIKFGCTRCSTTVKITSEEFERYKLSREAASALASFSPKPPKPAAPAESELEVWKAGDPAPHPDFDLSDPATAAAAMQPEEEHPPVFVKPQPPEPVKPAAPAAPPKTGPAPLSRPVPAAPATAAGAPVAPKVVQPRPATAPQPKPAASVRPASVPPSASPRPAPVVIGAVSQGSSGNGKRAVIVLLALILLGAGGFFAKSFFAGTSSSRHAIDLGKEVTPEGLQVMNASGGVDPVSGDLTISGVIENITDTPRPAWYVVVDLLDAQGTTLTQAKLVSGKQFYTRRDMEILARRGSNVQELMMKQLQEQGVVIPARGSVRFEIRILEPPIGVANFNAMLQPFDPVKLHKEMSEAQK